MTDARLPKAARTGNAGRVCAPAAGHRRERRCRSGARCLRDPGEILKRRLRTMRGRFRYPHSGGDAPEQIPQCSQKQKKRQARRLVFLFVLSDRTLNLVGTQASCTDVYMARSTVNNRFYPFDVGLPCSVGSSMRMGNFNSKSNALAADIALCHQLHLLAD